MSVKSLLFGVLNDAVGDFVVGLSPEHLKLGLWSGDIELKDLEVNVEAIKKLGLPLELKKGCIKALSLSIPWSSLGSSPVRVAITGVEVVASPDATELGADAIARAVAGDARRRAVSSILFAAPPDPPRSVRDDAAAAGGRRTVRGGNFAAKSVVPLRRSRGAWLEPTRRATPRSSARSRPTRSRRRATRSAWRRRSSTIWRSPSRT